MENEKETGKSFPQTYGSKESKKVPWADHFARLMESPDFFHTIVKTVPGNWQNIVADTPADIIAAGIIANVTKNVAESINSGKSLDKDTRAGIDLIQRLGYSYLKRVELNGDSSLFSDNELVLKVIKPKEDILEDK